MTLRTKPMSMRPISQDSDAIFLDNQLTRLLAGTAGILLLILVSGALLRLAGLGQWSLWIDELHTLYVAGEASLTKTGIPADQHPPLYHLFMQVWLHGGQREFWLRLPSAITGIVAIWMAWRIGVALEWPQFGLLAAALLALSPILIWYSRDARMYGPASLFWFISIYFYVQLLRRRRWLDVFGLAAATAAGLYTAYPTLALWLGQAMLLATFLPFQKERWSLLRRWSAAQLLIILAFAAWWPFLQLQLQRSSTFDWRLPAALQAEAAGNAGSLRFTILTFLSRLNFSGTLEDTLRLGLVAAGFAVVVIMAASLCLYRWPSLLTRLKRTLPLLAVMLVVVFVALTIAGAVPRGLSIRRQLLVFWPPLLLLGTWAILFLRRPSLTAAILILTLVLAFTTAFGKPYQDWRGAALLVAEQAQPDDLLWLSPVWVNTAFDYYYEGEVPYKGVKPESLAREWQSLPLPAGASIWLVIDYHPAILGYTEGVETWLADRAERQSSYSFSQYIRVVQYTVP
jgi:mannosyltransferase